MKKTMFFISVAYITFFLTFNVFAVGTKENVSRGVENKSSWQEEVDISSKPNGKYNVLVTVTDGGGNASFAGPFNIYIDPKSDLPVVGIANPSFAQIIPGHLNIVGMCFDDDAVDSVELILDGQKDSPIKATGTDFWSYYLDTSDLADGLHTIEACGIDINGLRGKPVKTQWILNRLKPLTAVNNIKLGELVSGRIKLKGAVADGNGLKSLSYSHDAKTFEDLRFSYDKKANLYHFDFSFDTKPISDGPRVLIFRAEDNAGSVSLYSWLFIVDNAKPEVKIVYPAVGQPVNGKFSAAGFAKDAIGLAKLEWQFGKNLKGEFEIKPGDPYWVHDFDVTGLSDNRVDLIITATDVTGNITKEVRTITIDKESDKPQLTIQTPHAGDSVNEKLFLRGMARDDDGVAEILYSFNNGPETSVKTDGAFSVDLPELDKMLEPGKYILQVRAVDINGVSSNPAKISLTVNGSGPNFPVPTVQIGKNPPIKYEYGMAVNPESGAVLTCLASAGSKLVSLAWKLGDGEEKLISAKSPQKDISIALDFKNAPWGVLPLHVKATDTAGREKSETFVFFVEDLTVPADVKDAVKLAEEENALDEAKKLTIISVNGEPYLVGMTVPIPLEANKSNIGSLIVNASAKNISDVVVNINNVLFKADVKKTSDPEILELNIPLTNMPTGAITFSVSALLDKTEKSSVKGVVSVVRSKDASFIDNEPTVYWLPDSNVGKSPDDVFSMDVGSMLKGYVNLKEPKKALVQSVELGNKAAVNVSIEGRVIYVSAKEDGYYKNIKIIVTDGFGKEYVAPSLSFRVGSTNPRIVLDNAQPLAWVQNNLHVSGRAENINGIASVSWSLDEGATWQDCSVKTDGKFVIDASLSGLPEGFFGLDIKAVSKTGGEKHLHLAFCKDTMAPTVNVIVPEKGDSVNGEITVVFKAEDAGKLLKAEYVPHKDDTASKDIIDLPINHLLSDMVGSAKRPLRNDMIYRFTDIAGNSTVLNKYDFVVDSTLDLPVVKIGVPSDDSVIRGDFEISGIAYDDDGKCKIYYKLDNGSFIELPDYTNSFALPMKLSDLTDNEHTFTVYAKDVNGVKGKEVSVKFYVSLSQPKGEIVSPGLGEIVKDIVTIKGKATDANGISKVQLSFDNGNTYVDAQGAENWTYTLNTRLLKDGSYIVFLKILDKYGAEGLYADLLTIDNTPPDLRLSSPIDGASTAGSVFLSGRTADNIKLSKLAITVTSLSKNTVPKELSFVDVELNDVISKTLDLSSLAEGLYNVELFGVDVAGNVSRVSRNIKIDKTFKDTKIELLYPLNGEYVQGVFNLYGTVSSTETVEKLILFVDGNLTLETTPTSTGYFKFTVTQENMALGNHIIHVQALTSKGSQFVSGKQSLNYNPSGPWVAIDNFSMGDFAFKRPWLKGKAGYSVSEDDKLLLSSKEATKAEKQKIKEKTLKRVEISFDNGKTFKDLGRNTEWKYRIENEDMAQGNHFILVRAIMENGETAITRSIVFVDRTAPNVELIGPEAGESFNNEIKFSGLSQDDVGLKDVKIELRKGDKSLYKLPSFFQGLYLDAHFWGETVWGIGLGLSFFDDNVKLQVQYGQLSPSLYAAITKREATLRYSGHVIGGKLLANLGVVPFRSFAGPDWEWLSMAFSLGANFSWFTQSQSGKGQMLSAVVAQIEFPRITFTEAKVFRTLSVYTEGQLWFIPTDANSEGPIKIKNLEWQISVGLRVNIF